MLMQDMSKLDGVNFLKAPLKVQVDIAIKDALQRFTNRLRSFVLPYLVTNYVFHSLKDYTGLSLDPFDVRMPAGLSARVDL